YLRTLLRWTKHTPLWALTAPPDRRLDLVNLITRRVMRKVGQLSNQSRAEKDRWGWRHLQEESQALLRLSPRRVATLLQRNPRSLALLDAIQATVSSSRGRRPLL